MPLLDALATGAEATDNDDSGSRAAVEQLFEEDGLGLQLVAVVTALAVANHVATANRSPPKVVA